MTENILFIQTHTLPNISFFPQKAWLVLGSFIWRTYDPYDMLFKICLEYFPEAEKHEINVFHFQMGELILKPHSRLIHLQILGSCIVISTFQNPSLFCSI